MMLSLRPIMFVATEIKLRGTTIRKHFCARPDALLIDDSDHNVEAFLAHGGQAILVPRPWNPLHCMPTLTFLDDAFKMFFNMY